VGADKDENFWQQRRVVDEFPFISTTWVFSFVPNTPNNGHCLVPAQYIDRKFKLGQWVNMQRRAKNKMSANAGSG
jgi:Helicase associated domain